MFNFENIRFDKLERALLGKLLALKSESWETTHQITIANSEDQNRWFDSLDQNVHTPRNLILVASTHNEKICSFMDFGIFKITDIDWANRTAFVAWDVFKNHRGIGLGKTLVRGGTTFCFRMLNLHRLNCEILETNIPSQKCAEVAGFVKEGIKRESVLKQGVYIDSGVYGMLSKDFALQLIKNQI